MIDSRKNVTSQSRRIISAAFKCISSKGYANVSLRDIAGEAGVVLSQLNYYYKNKEGLFKEVIKELTEKYVGEIDELLKRGKGEKEKVEFLIKYFKEMLKYNPQLFKLLYDLTSMSMWSKPLKKLENNFYNSMSNVIEKHIINGLMAKGKLKNYSPKTLSRILLGTLYGMSMQVLMEDEKEDATKVFDELKLMLQ